MGTDHQNQQDGHLGRHARKHFVVEERDDWGFERFFGERERSL